MRPRGGVVVGMAAPTIPSRRELNRLGISATLHCMTGCVLGEVVGLVIATALGWGDVASIAVAVGLAFVFGYALTSIPLFRANLAIGAIVPIALATDTMSIALMELIDNAFMVAIPGAMDSYLDDLLFWGPMLGGFAIAFPSSSSSTAGCWHGAGDTPWSTGTTSTDRHRGVARASTSRPRRGPVRRRARCQPVGAA